MTIRWLFRVRTGSSRLIRLAELSWRMITLFRVPAVRNKLQWSDGHPNFVHWELWRVLLDYRPYSFPYRFVSFGTKYLCLIFRIYINSPYGYSTLKFQDVQTKCNSHFCFYVLVLQYQAILKQLVSILGSKLWFSICASVTCSIVNSFDELSPISSQSIIYKTLLNEKNTSILTWLSTWL